MKQEQVIEHFAMPADEYEKLMVKLVPQYLEQHQIIYDLLPAEDKNYCVYIGGCPLNFYILCIYSLIYFYLYFLF